MLSVWKTYQTRRYDQQAVAEKKLSEAKDSLIPRAINDAKNEANIAAAAIGLKIIRSDQKA